MSNKSIAALMRAVLIGFALLGVGVYVVGVPAIGESLVIAYPEFAYAYMPWLIFISVTAVPCYAVLVLGWLIAGRIARGEAFSVDNSRLLAAVAVLAAVDAGYFAIGNIVFLLLGMNHPGILLASLAVAFVGVAICVASAVLSRLTSHAAVIEEENSLTI